MEVANAAPDNTGSTSGGWKSLFGGKVDSLSIFGGKTDVTAGKADSVGGKVDLSGKGKPSASEPDNTLSASELRNRHEVTNSSHVPSGISRGSDDVDFDLVCMYVYGVCVCVYMYSSCMR